MESTQGYLVNNLGFKGAAIYLHEYWETHFTISSSRLANFTFISLLNFQEATLWRPIMQFLAVLLLACGIFSLAHCKGSW